MKLRLDADYLAGAVVLAAIGAVAVAAILWIAWSDVGKWQHPRVWLTVAALTVSGTAWAFGRF